MVKIPNRDYRFMRMMGKAIISCAPPSEYQNVGIVCLPNEKREAYNKVYRHLESESRPMGFGSSHYFRTHNGTFLISIGENSSISLLSEPEDFHGRTFESLYIVGDANKITGPTARCLVNAIGFARVTVDLYNPETLIGNRNEKYT